MEAAWGDAGLTSAAPLLLVGAEFDEQAPPEQQAASFARNQGLIGNLAAELARVRPPAEAARAHRDFVEGLRGFDDHPGIDELRGGAGP